MRNAQPMTATGLSSCRMCSRRPKSTNCAWSPTSSCATRRGSRPMTTSTISKTRIRTEEPRVRRLKAPHLIHPAYFRASRNAKVVEILKDLWGTVRFDTGKLNMKSAGYGAPVEWHQDWAFYPHTNDDLAAVGIMLDDVDMENGPMMVVPGSHKGPIYDHHGPNGRFCGAMDPEKCDIDLSRALPVSARPGRSPCITSAPYTARRQFLGPRAPLSAVPVPRRRCLAIARPQGRHRQVQRAADRRRAEPCTAPRAGAGAHAVAAGRAPGIDLREPARQRKALFRNGPRPPDRGGITGRGRKSSEPGADYAAAAELPVRNPGERRMPTCPDRINPATHMSTSHRPYDRSWYPAWSGSAGGISQAADFGAKPMPRKLPMP